MSNKKKKKQNNEEDSEGDWVSYRPNIKVLDCTIRDGGLMNKHNFDDKTVKAVYDACVEAGIDYMEIGYKNSSKIFDPKEYGPWKHCKEEDVRRIVGENDTDLKISVMADAERCDYHEDIIQKKDSVIDIIRVATYIHQIPTALDMIQDAHDKGYETAMNIMAVTTTQEAELDKALKLIAESEAQVVTVVDSFGTLYSETTKHLINKYLKIAKEGGKEGAMHAHNNQQLAFANTIDALLCGATMLDASMAGLGRGAGNCHLELLLGFLHNPKYDLRTILKCIEETVEPLREKLGWGYSIPYMITGVLNQHPRTAIAHNATENFRKIVEFYDSVIEED